MTIALTGARRLISVLALLGVLAYAAAALVTVADVLGRLVGLPVIGVVDLVQLFIVTGAWLVMPFAFMTGAHVSVDFIANAQPRRISLALNIFGALVAAVLLTLMVWKGFETFQTRTMFGDRSQQLGIPIAWYWYAFLVALPVAVLGVLVAAVDQAGEEGIHE
ncbi:TRAP transporter small permease [Chelativorans sp. YIM 93263]|uniref:TRAP transporter small permease n=1 Tax=Chelativorans sp. YIM 93263 TaxID=2906648 RepID=UPI0023792B8F|nr:TRAP transporter small permease subunit [Chelativorans sp. YIM 93263]